MQRKECFACRSCSRKGKEQPAQAIYSTVPRVEKNR